MRLALRTLALCLLALVLAGAASALWLRSRDPFASLPRERGEATVVAERRERSEGRVLLHVVLEGRDVGRTALVVSLPDPPPPRPVPVVVVLGGLSGATRRIRQLASIAGDPGPNAFVGYDWPLPDPAPGVLELARRAPELRRRVLSVPGQVDAILRWAERQPWADRQRVSLLGFSLGALVVPAAQRLAEARGSGVGFTVLAYGGAPIGAVIAGHPGLEPRWLRRPLGAAADVLLRPVEPSLHLPYVRGRFLVLGARTDELIAPGAAARLRELTPEPRTVILLEGDHMGRGPERAKLLARVVDASRAWLVAQGAMAPASR